MARPHQPYAQRSEHEAVLKRHFESLPLLWLHALCQRRGIKCAGDTGVIVDRLIRTQIFLDASDPEDIDLCLCLEDRRTDVCDLVTSRGPDGNELPARMWWLPDDACFWVEHGFKPRLLAASDVELVYYGGDALGQGHNFEMFDVEESVVAAQAVFSMQQKRIATDCLLLSYDDQLAEARAREGRSGIPGIGIEVEQKRWVMSYYTGDSDERKKKTVPFGGDSKAA